MRGLVARNFFRIFPEQKPPKGGFFVRASLYDFGQYCDKFLPITIHASNDVAPMNSISEIDKVNWRAVLTFIVLECVWTWPDKNA